MNPQIRDAGPSAVRILTSHSSFSVLNALAPACVAAGGRDYSIEADTAVAMLARIKAREAGDVVVLGSAMVAELAGLYRNFIATFEPLRASLAAGARPSEADAITARIVLIHEFRRIVLRDPSLPDAVLPNDWPGRSARELTGDLYRRLTEPSERWLDQALTEDGPLPRSDIAIANRFHNN